MVMSPYTQQLKATCPRCNHTWLSMDFTCGNCNARGIYVTNTAGAGKTAGCRHCNTRRFLRCPDCSTGLDGVVQKKGAGKGILWVVLVILVFFFAVSCLASMINPKKHQSLMPLPGIEQSVGVVVPAAIEAADGTLWNWQGTVRAHTA